MQIGQHYTHTYEDGTQLGFTVMSVDRSFVYIKCDNGVNSLFSLGSRMHKCAVASNTRIDDTQDKD